MASRIDDDDADVDCGSQGTAGTMPPSSEARQIQAGAASSSAVGRVQEVFGDTNLSLVMVVLMLLHLLQHALRDPCTC